MANKLSGLEIKLYEWLVRGAPSLPKVAKAAVVAWIPIISLVAGLLALWTAWNMWQWANAFDGTLGSVCNAYSVKGCGNAVASRFSIWLWASIALLGAEGLLFLAAYGGLHDRKKAGWDLLYYAGLINVTYIVVSPLSGYNKIGGFVAGLISSAICIYFLFQIREAYAVKKRAAAPVSRRDSRKA